MGFAPALYEEIAYDELGNNLNGTFMDYLLPTAVETPAWETGKKVTPSPHHPIGAKGGGGAATRRPPVRPGHGRRGPAADLGPARGTWPDPARRHDRGLGRRQLRPA